MRCACNCTSMGSCMEQTQHKHGRESGSYVGLVVMIVGGTLSGLTQTAMNTMLPAVAVDFGISVAVGQWLVTAFMLCLAITMPTVAFLSRRFSARSLYSFALAVFSLGSVMMAAACGLVPLMIGRVLQGCSAGIILPLLQVVVFTQFPLEKRGTIMGFVGLAFGFAPNVGPTIGGALQSAFGWRSFFWALLAFTTVLLVLTLTLVGRGDARTDAARKLDAPSLLLSTMGFGGVLLGITHASSYGLASAACLVPLVGGAVVVMLFARRQLTLEFPFLDMRVFAYCDMTAGTVAICLLFAAFIGMSLVIPLELQQLHGCSALVAGMVMLPGTVAAVAMNPISGFMYDRWGPRGISLAGAALLFIGTIAMLHLSAMGSVAQVTFWQTVRAFGISSLIIPLTTWSVSALPSGMTPDGTSVTNAFRQIAAALGTSVMVLLMAGGSTSGAVTATGVDHAVWFSLGATAIMAAICMLFVKRSA